MRTHYENWSVENIVGLIVSTAVVVLPTAGCGAALLIQARGIAERRAASFSECNLEAAGAPKAASAVADASPWLYGLRSELRESGPAREAFEVCMDDRPFASLARTINE